MAHLNLTPIEGPDKMMNYWKREWRVISAVTFFGLLFNASMSLGPILQGRLIDSLVNRSSLHTIAIEGGTFIGVILLIQIMRFFKRYYVRLFSNRTSATMRMMIYNNIMHKDIIELSKEQTGDLMTKAISDVDITAEGMRKVTTEVFDTGVLMAAYLISMLIYDWKITLAASVFIPLAMWLAEYLKKTIVKYSKVARGQMSHVADLTYQNIEHTVLLRVNGLEGKNRKAYFEALDDLEHKSIQASILENSMQPVYNAIALMGMGIVLYFGGQRVISGAWTVGMFATYMIIFVAQTTKASKAGKLFNAYQKASVSWHRIQPYLKPHQDKDDYDRGLDQKACLVVADLSFTYPMSEQIVVSCVTFSAEPGQIIGITGPVACGKSSLGVAIQGLYPYLGSIRFGDVELSELSQTEKSNRISYLGHQPQLLSDTIYHNITLGDEGDISDVLRHVCFEQDLLSMPDGIHTRVGSSGVRLSGGQQARIALARALYRKCPLLILDDPFSAVDKQTEEAIIKNIRTYYSERIILLISHRLTVFSEADKVLLMAVDGTAETGLHDGLLRTSAFYRTIYQLQAGGGRDDV